jgi:hypothetical protein
MSSPRDGSWLVSRRDRAYEDRAEHGDEDASRAIAGRHCTHIPEDHPMSHNDSPRLARRGFLARLSASAAGLAVFSERPRLRSELSALTLGASDPDAWIGRLRGTDRLVLHAHEHLMPAIARDASSSPCSALSP